MGSIRTSESISKLVKLTVSTLQLPASRLNIGAAQYVTSALTLNTAVSGVGGLDAAIAAGALYYVYAVVSSGTVYLIGSTNSSLPSGFTQARQVGGFTTDASSQIDQVGEYPGNLAVAGSVSAGGGLTAYPTQNFLINGAFDISQRYADTSISNIGSDKYTMDRWWVNSTNMADQYVQRVAVTDLPGFRYALKIARTANTGAVGRVQQPLEYANVLPLQGKAVTLSFYYKTTGTSLTAPYAIAFFDTATADMKEPSAIVTNLPYYTPTTTWQRYTATFTVPATAKSMNVSLMRSASTGVGDILFTGVMLNIGTQPAPFQRAGGTIGGELALCQRYYEKSYDPDVATGSTVANGMTEFAGNGGVVRGTVYFRVTKRTSANLGTFYSPATGVSGKARDASGSTDINCNPNSWSSNSIGFFTGTTVNGNSMSVQWAIDAEL